MDGSIITVLFILAMAVILLITDLIRIDLVAIMVMLTLGWTGILSADEAFAGFSSNAVVAMMGVMIISQGLANTGIILRMSQLMLKKISDNQKMIVLTVSLMAGVLSGILITVGVAALFLPVMLQISRQRKIPTSDLLIPIGFSAILGANLTMVGSAPLIVLNDLLLGGGMEPYGLLGVAPVGIALLAVGLLYFWFLGKKVLPDTSGKASSSYQEQLMETLHLHRQIHHYKIPSHCPMDGKTIDEIDTWKRFHLHVLALANDKKVQYIPWRGTTFQPGQTMALLGDSSEARQFAEECGLEKAETMDTFDALHDLGSAGFAEVIVTPRSEIADSTLREFSLRKKYAVEPLILFSHGEEVRDDFSDHKIKQGDTLVVYGLWKDVDQMKDSGDFIVITPFSTSKHTPQKTPQAVACLVAAVLLTLIGFPVSLAFFTGAIVMVLAGVIKMQEAYKAIDWKVIFLLAGLIPLGTAMQKSGTAEWIAESIMGLIEGKHHLFFIVTVAALASFFSLFMSNVGAVVVLTPLVISMSSMADLDPRPMVLLAAVCASNAFVLPTHQVNALLLSPGGYKNRDFMKAGSGMTLIYLVVTVSYFYLFMN